MKNKRMLYALTLACAILVTFIASAGAVEYNPSVSVGQWVKYGNLVAIGSGVPSDFNKTEWMKMEVVAVSGKSVTLHSSGKYKNGSATSESGMIVNVETGSMNTTTAGGFFPVIAGNLQAGDILPGSTFKINKTETRTYAGASRSVNIVDLTTSVMGYSYKYLLIWDKASGMILEMEISMTMATITSKMSLKATETNIWAGGIIPGVPDYVLYIIVAVVVIVIIVAAVLVMRKRKAPTPTAVPTPTTKPSTEEEK